MMHEKRNQGSKIRRHGRELYAPLSCTPLPTPKVPQQDSRTNAWLMKRQSSEIFLAFVPGLGEARDKEFYRASELYRCISKSTFLKLYMILFKCAGSGARLPGGVSQLYYLLAMRSY